MNKPHPVLPDRIETERLYLRGYKPGDGPMYFAVSRKNRAHLARYESDNVLMNISSEEEAESAVCELAADWKAGNCFFVGGFDKKTDEFVTQIYIGPVNRELPEFQIGYVADIDHEGKGYVTEAVRAVIGSIFKHLRAHRISLECDDTNIRSFGVAERCGFTREGYFRENKKNSDGSISGTYHYAILRSEFGNQ